MGQLCTNSTQDEPLNNSQQNEHDSHIGTKGSSKENLENASTESGKSQTNGLTFDFVKNEELFVVRRGGWLEARYHFRFDQWRPNQLKFPKKYNFGCLYVMNDDIIECDSGFGSHPHSNVDIFTYVINGFLTHQDSQGNDETLGRGCIQYMSVGDTIWHSEMNRNENEKCRLIQTWIKPENIPNNESTENKKRNMFEIEDEKEEERQNILNENTQYGSRRYELGDRHNKLLRVIASNNGNNNDGDCIKLREDVNVYVCQLDENKEIEFEMKEQRQVYLVCMEGKLKISWNNANDKENGEKIEMNCRDSIRLYGNNEKRKCILRGIGKEGELDDEMKLAMPSAHFMAIEMKQTNQADAIHKQFRPNDPYWTDSSDEDAD